MSGTNNSLNAPLMAFMLLLALTTGGCSEDNDHLPSPQSNCSVLTLLNIEPIRYAGEGDEVAGTWDRGMDVIPAGHLAIEQINNRSDILEGYQLQLIDVDSEACGLNAVITEGVTNVFRELVKPDRQDCIVGVVGLLCSATTKAISPIVSHQKIGGYVQLSSSTAPVLSTGEESDLFHIVESSRVFNEATISLMDVYGWSRISIVHSSLGLFSETVANDFVERINSLSNLELVSRVSLSESYEELKETFDTLRDNDARISYWSVDYDESSHLLCEAYRRNSSWPGYIYILREPILSNILNKQTTSCTKEQLLAALDGSFLLQYRLYVDNDTMLCSGVSFSEYKDMYLNKLEEFASRMNVDDFAETDYANTLYDQVWAFALALNNSLPSIDSQNLSFSDYRLSSSRPDAPLISSVLKDELKNITFQGATGEINFNQMNESPTFVDIFQVQNGTPQLIGVYNPFTRNISFTSSDPRNMGKAIPSDSFQTRYKLLPVWFRAFIVTTQVALFCLITANLLLILRWRKTKEIKATSLLLSVQMMVGCYMLCMGPIFLTAAYSVDRSHSNKLIRAFCIIINLTSVGFEVILAPLFFRLLRIQLIFRSKHMTMMSDYWMDKYLFIYALLICAGQIVLLVLWNSISPVTPVIKRTYIQNSITDLPYYDSTMYCTDTASRVWLIVSLSYTIVLLLLLVILAIMTRHIKNQQYKDTKKVNIFIFLVMISIAVTVPLLIFFIDIDNQTGAIVVEWLAYLSVPLFCQVCIFVPKTLPLIMKKSKREYFVTSPSQSADLMLS